MARRMLLTGLVGTAAILALTAAAPPGPTPFPAGSTTDTIQGQQVADPYRELENAADPKVTAWSDAQNVRTRAYLDALPGRAAVAAKLTRMFKDRSPAFGGLHHAGSRTFAYYSDPALQQGMLVTLNGAADPATRKPLVDPNTMDPSGHTAIDWFVPSPDGSKVAVSISQNGSEDGTLHIYDAVTGKEVEAPIDRVQFPTAGGSLAWTGDGKAFWYTRYPEHSQPESEWHFNQNTYLHVLGTPVSQDKLVLSATDGIPRTAEIFLSNAEDGAAALASVQWGDGGQWLHYVLTTDGKARKIAEYEDRVIGGAVIAKDGTVFGVSRKDAPMGKVVKLAAPYTGGLAKAQVIVPSRTDGAIVDGGQSDEPLVLANGKLFVTRIAGGPNSVGIYDLAGKDLGALDVPPVSSVSNIVALPGGDVLYDVNGYTQPPHYLRWSAGTMKSTPTAIRMTTSVSYADAEVKQIFATSKDGTKVPVTLVMKKGTKLDGKNPLLLYGYGGYGVNMTPGFSAARTRMLLDGGMIYALANIRGGGEYGETWHQQGMLTKKQNVFDDFTAAAQTLIAQGYTSHDKLALQGGSNGGLLMGAQITQHPDLAKAVISQVGIYDMLRVELDPNGAFNVTEFGTVKDPAQFKALYAYSPYHHVVKGTAYPAVLLMTGANDGRVNPFHSRKFAAALQAATSSKAPILLRTSASSGHGQGSSLDEVIAQQTDMTMFLFDQLGVDAARAAAK
ncbi:prolyl oligopeptidase family protein [Novosphingobium sp. 9U]|uniref:prolyl oligopeptidase family serine peptidase n=1 Tax=Novosphingobium sp. 9U TaxID=2653158 RepID=UPI0012EF8E2A|nr:prolyl oligopeptidase family serine peptidase [Novosphingobium sp. 9U]VWX52852.1 putative Prolyl endopeptidase [Novosphingobium sp. 9U]